MAQTKINASQTTITAEDIGAAGAVTALPTAGAGEEGKIYQFTGTTDANYTNGYFYKCVSDGAVTPTYSWTQTNVQPAGGGSSYTAGTGIDITNNTISMTIPVVKADNGIAMLNPDGYNYSNIMSHLGTSTVFGGNIYTRTGKSINMCTAVGQGISFDSSYTVYRAAILSNSGTISANNVVAIGTDTNVSKDNCICIGYHVTCSAIGAIQIGSGTNNEAGTLCIGLSQDGNTYTNYKFLDYNGTIPEARLADTTSAAQGDVLTLDSNLNAVWAAPSGGGATSATATLAVADWSSNTQTVNVTGVTASNNVIVAAAPASQSDYASFGVLCTAQGAGTLTFTCTTTPTNAITVNVLII